MSVAAAASCGGGSEPTVPAGSTVTIALRGVRPLDGWGLFSGVTDFLTDGEEEFPGDDWISNPLGYPSYPSGHSTISAAAAVFAVGRAVVERARHDGSSEAASHSPSPRRQR